MRIGSDRRKIWHVDTVAQEITIYETVPTLIVVLSAESLDIMLKLVQL